MNSRPPEPIRIYKTVSQAIAYLVAGIFLLTTSGTSVPSVGIQIFGVIFLVVAFLLVISPFCNFLLTLVNRLDNILFGGLFAVTLALLVKTWVDTAGFSLLFKLVLAFFIVMLAAFIYSWFKEARLLSKEIGGKAISIRVLRAISITLSIFAGALLLFGVTDLGNPVLYLAGGLLTLSIASFIVNGQRVQ